MIVFGEITSKTVRATYQTVVDGFKVAGSATYNKEHQLTDAHGAIVEEDNHIGTFNIYGYDNERRMNISDCPPEMMNKAAEIAQSVLADLAATYPRE